MQRARTPAALASCVRDELEQRAVRVAEVDTRPAPARAPARDRADLDFHAVLAEMVHGAVDRPLPLEAQVAVAWPDAVARDRMRVEAGAVHVQLVLAEAVVADAR